MRTKIILTAAVALAAGLVSSYAQVYSANIVGYVTYTSSTVSPQFEVIDNPLDTGSNTIKNVFPSAPGGTQILIWNGSGYTTATYSTLLGGHWKIAGVTSDSTLIPPGIGVFVSVGSGVFTNTFVGTVVPWTGGVSNTTENTGLQLVSSLVPYADYVTNSATIGLTNVAGGTQLLLWNKGNQGFDTYTWSTLLGGHWKLNGVNTTPYINVGQGFFLNPASTYVWKQTGP